MSQCCIPYKKLDNINGSSQVTFNGKTSFDGIDEIDAETVVCAELIADTIEADSIESGTVRTVELFSEEIENKNNIKTDTFEANTVTITTINSTNINNAESIKTDTLEATTSVTAANITISEDTITSTNSSIDVRKPLHLQNGSSDYVCHLPASGVQATYYWPSVPGILSDLYIKLLYNDSGVLRWEEFSPVSLNPLGYTIEAGYAVSDSGGNIAFSGQEVEVPAWEVCPEIPAPVIIEKHLSCSSGGELSFTNSIIVVGGCIPIPESS